MDAGTKLLCICIGSLAIAGIEAVRRIRNLRSSRQHAHLIEIIVLSLDSKPSTLLIAHEFTYRMQKGRPAKIISCMSITLSLDGNV